MNPKSKSPAARQSGRAGKQFKSTDDSHSITVQPFVCNGHAARILAARFGLPMPVASLVAELAGLG